MRNILIIFICAFLLTSFVSALCSEGQIDINSANATELDKLAGIGPAYAKEIINSRPFNSIDSLIDVKGIGPITLEKIKNQSLACVSNQEEKQNASEEDTSQAKTTKDEILENYEEPEPIKITSKEIQNTPKEEVKTIVLTPLTAPTPKDIKSEIDKEELNKNKLAIYGLVTFCILLVFLFVFKKMRKEKNEFK